MPKLLENHVKTHLSFFNKAIVLKILTIKRQKFDFFTILAFFGTFLSQFSYVSVFEM